MDIDANYYPMDVDDDVQQMLQAEITYMRQSSSIPSGSNETHAPVSISDGFAQIIAEPCAAQPFAWEVQPTNASAHLSNAKPTTLAGTPPQFHTMALVVDTNYLISYLRSVDGRARVVFPVFPNSPTPHSFFDSFMKDLMKWIPTPQMVVIVPYVVIKELDSLKEPHKRKVAQLAYAVEDRVKNQLNTINEGANAQSSTGDRLSDSARAAIHFIYELQRSKHPGYKGQASGDYLPGINLPELNNDDRILECARFVQNRITPNVLMMTNDKNLAIKTGVHGIEVVAHYKHSAQAFLNEIRKGLGLETVPIVGRMDAMPTTAKTNGAQHTPKRPKPDPHWGLPPGNNKASAGAAESPSDGNQRQTRSAKSQAASPLRKQRRNSAPLVTPAKQESLYVPTMPKRKRVADDDCSSTPANASDSGSVDFMDIDEIPSHLKNNKKRRGSPSAAVEPSPSPESGPILTKAQRQATNKLQQEQYEGVQEAKKMAIKLGTSGDLLDIVCNELCRTLPPLLSTGFQHVFERAGPNAKLNVTSPPWSLEELFRMLEQHWGAQFSPFLGKAFDAGARKFCLQTSASLVRGLKYGRTGATLGECRKFVDHLIVFAQLLRKSGCLGAMHDNRRIERLLQGLKEKLQRL
ncbi:RNA endoribonuclease [Geranomyces michiganensis]|nr:RNA endoribonuclease [Geranomyces michiganensis]